MRVGTYPEHLGVRVVPCPSACCPLCLPTSWSIRCCPPLIASPSCAGPASRPLSAPAAAARPQGGTAATPSGWQTCPGKAAACRSSCRCAGCAADDLAARTASSPNACPPLPGHMPSGRRAWAASSTTSAWHWAARPARACARSPDAALEQRPSRRAGHPPQAGQTTGLRASKARPAQGAPDPCSMITTCTEAADEPRSRAD